MEKPANIQMICDKCAPKPTGQFKGLGAALVGKHVKLGFPVINPRTGTDSIEHMWVKVQTYARGRYTGMLDNEPVYECKYKLNDTVRFTAGEIEAVFNEGSC